MFQGENHANSSTQGTCNPQEETLFEKINAYIAQNVAYGELMRKQAGKYNLGKSKIVELTPQKAKYLYQSLRKQNTGSGYDTDCTAQWSINELKLFYWFLIGFSYYLSKNIQNFGEKQWIEVHNVFLKKQPIFLEFQSRIMLAKREKERKWTKNQEALLRNILVEKQILLTSKIQITAWKIIAFQLYSQSDKQYFRLPKKVREFYYNHVAQYPRFWSPEEDIELLSAVLNYGKKWAIIARTLKCQRTENMVKNRYNSIIRNMPRWKKERSKEETLVRQIITKYEKQAQKSSLADSDENKKEEEVNFIFEQSQLRDENAFDNIWEMIETVKFVQPHQNTKNMMEQRDIELINFLDEDHFNHDLPYF